jgi:hypothetical protein
MVGGLARETSGLSPAAAGPFETSASSM